MTDDLKITLNTLSAQKLVVAIVHKGPLAM